MQPQRVQDDAVIADPPAETHDGASTPPPAASTGSHPSHGPAHDPPAAVATATARTAPRVPPATTAAPVGNRPTGRVVGMAVSVTAAVSAFDVSLTDRLSLFFDLCFVLVGLSAALLVRRRGLFAVAVLPPLLLGATVAVLAVVMPNALTASHLAFVSTWLTGLAHHATGLVATHVVVLAIVWARAAQQPRR